MKLQMHHVPASKQVCRSRFMTPAQLRWIKSVRNHPSYAKYLKMADKDTYESDVVLHAFEVGSYQFMVCDCTVSVSFKFKYTYIGGVSLYLPLGPIHYLRRI